MRRNCAIGVITANSKIRRDFPDSRLPDAAYNLAVVKVKSGVSVTMW
jgi:hypothetical protein